MLDSINTFLQSSLGVISIRLLCVSFIGAGASLIIQRIFANSKRVAELTSYILNIILSVMVSMLYSKDIPIHEQVIEGVFYGLGALTAQYVFSSGAIFKLIKGIKK